MLVECDAFHPRVYWGPPTSMIAFRSPGTEKLALQNSSELVRAWIAAVCTSGLESFMINYGEGGGEVEKGRKGKKMSDMASTGAWEQQEWLARQNHSDKMGEAVRDKLLPIQLH